VNSEAQKNKQTMLRDYDKEPIVIEDYNPLFLALWTLTGIPLVILIYIFNPGGTSSQSLSFNVFIILPMLMFPYIYGYIKTKKKRKIKLLNNEIILFHNDVILETINLNDITELRKTFSDLYHKSQHPNDFGRLMSYILFPIAIYMNIALLVNRLLFHIYKDGFKSYRLYDAIIVFADKKFINILPITQNEYNEVKKYFYTKKKVNIDRTNVFFDLFGHMPEKIDLKGDK
jgi:hypothetical protein